MSDETRRFHSEPRNFFVRGLADLVVGIAAVGGFIAASKNGETAAYWLIAVACGLLMSAIMAGYFEPSAKRVWCHALLIMWPELLALPVALMTCKGHGCAGFVAFLFLASLFTLILMAASFGAFFIRRRRT